MATPLFHFDFTTQQPEDVKLEGGAMYPADNKCLRLTKTVTDSRCSITPEQMNWGRAIYTKAVAFSNQTTFQTTIKFTIKPTANNATPADGLVFFMAPYGHKFPADPCDGNLGIFDPQSGDASNVFAVEFDTFINPKWDPNYFPHLGINIQSRNSEPARNVGNPSYIGREVTLTINYDSGKITAKVKINSDPAGFTTTKSYDLSAILTQQDNEVEVGLAASTGDNVAFHDVVYWDLYSPAPMPN